MKTDLHLTLIEHNSIWEDIHTNLCVLEEKIQAIKTDIIVLPEMFATGFSMNTSRISQEENGSIVEWMKNMSTQHQTAICGSISIQHKDSFYNTFYFIAKGKIHAKYQKRHLFTYGNEQKYYEKGNEKITFEYEGWKICPMICYDLRFPVWCRNDSEYDLLLNVANWPISRIENWKILHQARAIENQCYAVGCNRTGIDGNNLEYNGNSLVVNSLGKILEPKITTENLLHYTISKLELMKIRTTFPFLEDRDCFTIHIE